ncbi:MULTISPECIES: TonB-dependent receptor [unclassified Arcicella]|uniref:SusC/RagA family TonB-linked outer membrane protein n=1 Tax=unclassified Arcicella TaxID=2644986 RepID=UPI002864F31C|nr:MULTISPECIES: TonB-dependent receptor [unclassified Arcicella]MDR6562067.1 TonB-linked SusC/RagA family outer membrane protein [Arcicella sp. BE51]MDR6811939.1 TonB-linked SusC/RagA family outer membrane protein [Arcicella sp. BE140]MDR6822969.1 TonB-linked SusC/RagA family outer membrane protein [Arcicella sp. BE139]
MKNKLLRLIFMLTLVFISMKAQSQQLTGKIIDSRTKEPIIGAAIAIKGTSIGVTTDVNGKFILKTSQKPPFTVIATFVGYKKKEIEIIEFENLNISLIESKGQRLDEVIVVGYGTQKRSDITGSIASVPLEIKSQPVASVERLLQGSVAGAIVTQTSGQPGGGVSVQIRGNNSITAGSDPLYVIDGFPINNDYSLNDAGVTNGSKINPLSSINTADIESIDVLKDASATAIYGSRGANGVVIVTTKNGSKGKSSINYDAYYGVQEVIRTLPVLNARDWWALRKDAAKNSGKTTSLPSVTGYSLDTSGVGTDWQAAAFRKAAIQSHSLSILSGSDKTRLSISGNYFKQDGVLQNTDFIRYSGRFGLDHDYNKRFKITSSLSVSTTKSQVAPAAIVGNLLLTPPSLPIYKDDGTFVVNSPFESGLQNPINSLYNQLNETITNRILGNVAGEYTLAEGLKAKVLFGIDIVDNKQNRYLPSSTAEGLALSGDAIVGTAFTSNWLNENTLSYDKEIDAKNKINAVVGFTAQQSKSKGAVAEAAGFATDAFSYNNLGTGITARTPSSFASEWALASYLGRVNYVHDDKYLVTLTLRADGSSRFGDGNKWGYFPSAAFGWNVSNEKFFQNVKNVSSFKVRLSAGSTGNQNIPSYQSLSQLSYFRYNFSNTTVSGYAPNTVPNPNLGWEKTFQIDGGIDVGLFNNRISLVADYYYKKTTDLLLTRTVPGTSGLSDFYNGQASVIYQNIGAVANQGFELYINSHNIDSDLKWNTTLVYSNNSNKILNLGDGVDQIIPSISSPSIAKVGYPLGSFIVYQTDGIIQSGDVALTPQANKSPGGQKYKDISGPNGVPDGVISQAYDRVVISNQPAFTAGLTNTFNYKGFDLAIFFQASIGGKIYNANRANLELGTGYVNASTDLLNRWTPTNTNTDVKAAYQDPAITISDRFIEDATYYRLKNISLGYTIPAKIVKKANIKSLRVYISAQNAATWTKYTGYDPEVSLNGQSLINKGIDSGVYPNNKSYQVGISLSF